MSCENCFTIRTAVLEERKTIKDSHRKKQRQRKAKRLRKKDNERKKERLRKKDAGKNTGKKKGNLETLNLNLPWVDPKKKFACQ